jgi:sugar diacid utilization regulator
MNGDIDNCGKLAGTYAPGLLDTGQVQVCLLECPAARRPAVIEAVTATVGTAALVVAHPGSATRVAVVTPARPGDESTRLRQTLQAAVAPYGCAIGQSRAVSCRNTRDAHQMASHALAVARRLPHRSVTHQGDKPLALLLGPEAAGWARWVLRRLDALPDREVLIQAVQQALQHGHSGAARLIGVNRKTIAMRCRRAGTALGYDLTDLRARATLDLALHLALRAPQAAPPAAPPLLADLLRAPAARAWALDLLAPLRRDSRPLLETVQAWITCNGRVESCAEELKVHANTVRNHLAACEAALGRRLVGTSGGAYDVVNAMEILHAPGVAR